MPPSHWLEQSESADGGNLNIPEQIVLSKVTTELSYITLHITKSSQYPTNIKVIITFRHHTLNVTQSTHHP